MKLKNLFRHKKSKFGEIIFHQRTWLTKQVDEAILKARTEQHVTLGAVKEQKTS